MSESKAKAARKPGGGSKAAPAPGSNPPLTAGPPTAAQSVAQQPFDGQRESRPTQAERLLAVVNSQLDKVKLADNVTHADVTGPTPLPGPGGNVIPVWTVMVSIKHTMQGMPLLGAADIVVANNTAGELMPKDGEFEKLAVLCLEQARMERDKRNAS